MWEPEPPDFHNSLFFNSKQADDAETILTN